VSPQLAVGRAIRRHRRAADITQSELAARVGVDVQTVCQWERGNRRIAFLAVCAVAQVLGVPIAEFVPPSLSSQP